jgi:hypothetical protein
MSSASRHLLPARRPAAIALATAALLSSVLCPPPMRAAESTNPAEVKRIADRYALTKARISAMLDQRLRPIPLPANPPNPFYQPPKEVAGTPLTPGGESPDTALIPEAADLSDIDTLRKYAPTLKIGGVLNRNGALYLTLNNTTCKVGDIITVGKRDHPIYLKMLSLSASEFSLGLNDAVLSVPLKK